MLNLTNGSGTPPSGKSTSISASGYCGHKMVRNVVISIFAVKIGLFLETTAPLLEEIRLLRPDVAVWGAAM